MNSTKKAIKNETKLETNPEKRKKKRVFSKKHYSSGDGMITSIWGPNIWHYLHTLSFNYPIKPTLENKKYYKEFIINLQYTLPCKQRQPKQTHKYQAGRPWQLPRIPAT